MGFVSEAQRKWYFANRGGGSYKRSFGSGIPNMINNEEKEDSEEKVSGSVYKEELTTLMGKDYKAFVDNLKDNANDPKVLAAIKSGLEDGSKKDDIVKIKDKVIEVDELRPVQNEVDIGKSLYYPMKNIETAEKILKGKEVEIMSPIVTYQERYIIDGHHRWSQIYAVNSNATIKSQDLTMKGARPLTVLKAVQMSVVATTNKLPTEHVEGTNLLTANEEQVKSYVRNNLSEELIPIYSKYGAGNNKEEIADYIWKNVKVMQSKSQPIEGAPERGYMPQTDKAAGWEKEITSGSVNWSKPR